MDKVFQFHGGLPADGGNFMQGKTDNLDVTEEEIKAEYEILKEAGQLQNPETVDVAHILIRVQGDDEALWEAAKERIEAARTRVTSGEDFETVMNLSLKRSSFTSLGLPVAYVDMP